MKNSPLITALDVEDKKEAVSLVKELKDYVSIFKIGPVLFTRYGPDIVKEIKEQGAGVFLDLKFYDIPNTIASAVQAIAELGIDMFTVHISGGEEMLKAAVNALTGLRSRPKILGVTILTSTKNAPIEDILRMAEIAKNSGLDGVICSPLEISAIRKAFGRDFLIITPGIRPSGIEAGDQKRIATPKTAIKNGADYIVVGRPIIESANPLKVVKEILADISSL